MPGVALTLLRFLTIFALGVILPACPLLSRDTDDPKPPLVSVTTADGRVEVFDDTWQIVKDHYLAENINGLDWQAIHDEYAPLIRNAEDADEFYGLMIDMIDQLGDEHSSFELPAMVHAEEASYTGDPDEVGIGVSYDGASYTIFEVYPGSPADKAGIKRRDRILAANGRPVPAEASWDQPDGIDGPEGTTVRLEVQSPGEKPRTIAVERAPIDTGSSAAVYRLASAPQIGYIFLPTFDVEGIDQQVENGIAMLLDAAPLEGLIVDVRGNPGGSDAIRQQITGQFVVGVGGHFRGREETVDDAIEASPLYDRLKAIPLAVLVDSNSHSAAEIFAASIQSLERGVIVGKPSAGNVERIYSHDLADGSLLWLAEEDFEYADGDQIEGHGVTPDVLVNRNWIRYAERDDPFILAAVDALRATKH